MNFSNKSIQLLLLFHVFSGREKMNLGENKNPGNLLLYCRKWILNRKGRSYHSDASRFISLQKKENKIMNIYLFAVLKS
jgi:hypothetical protein